MYEEKRITRLTLENGDKKVTWEVDYNDTNMEDLLNAFYSLCIGITYLPSTVLSSMKEYAKENLPYIDPEYKEGEDEDII